jgi:formylglycine-generating enzyme required for sulfatase activity
MQLDEDGTYARVRRIQRDLIEPTIAEHYGKLVKTTGDGFIAIFDSPVEAVRCGIVIQQSMVGRNASLPRQQWIVYRIGVNLGDVIVETEDVYGDGVNVASRLEGIADPGQIYISGGIYEQVKHKLVCGYQSLGDRQIKNITDPVRVYRVLPDPAALISGRRWPMTVLISAFIALAVALAAVGGALWYLPTKPTATLAPKPLETAKATPPPPMPSPKVREPEMIGLVGGSFSMGSDDDPSERPIHRVTIKPFSLGKFPVTVREWNECAAAKACPFTSKAKDDAPVTDVSWNDAKKYVTWLVQATGKPYRLPTEGEWEYAARGGTQTKYWWGDQFRTGMLNCRGCFDVTVEQPATVGTFKANPFGLHEMGGSVDQWVEDCWSKSYQGAPADGSPWLEGDCSTRVIRSGSWRNDARSARPSSRDRYDAVVRYPTHGFRVAISR